VDAPAVEASGPQRDKPRQQPTKRLWLNHSNDQIPHTPAAQVDKAVD